MDNNDPFSGLSHGAALKKIGIDSLRSIVAAERWKINDPHKHGEAIEAIRRFDASKVDEELSKREKREKETLEIAKEANRLASEANSIARLEAAAASRSARYAMYAAIIAAVGAIAANKNEIFNLIEYLIK